MRKFPVTVFDGFFETPDLVRQFALSQKFNQTDDGRWPGYRSDPLSELNPGLFETFCFKLFKLFYNFDYTNLSWDVEASFQKVPPMRKKDYKNINQGWIHSDDAHFSGVIYLNKNFPPNTGTSIYRPKDIDCLEFSIEEKCKFYLGEDISEEEYLAALTKNNDQFVETIKVENIFNRLMVFEGEVFHGVPSFFSETEEDRLTLVFFVKKLEVRGDTSPIQRSRDF